MREDTRVTSEIAFSVGRRTRTVQLVSDPVRRDEGGATPAYRTMLVDVSELKQLQDRLRLLSEAGERLASSLDYTVGLDAAARATVPALSDLCIIDVFPSRIRSSGRSCSSPIRRNKRPWPNASCGTLRAPGGKQPRLG